VVGNGVGVGAGGVCEGGAVVVVGRLGSGSRKDGEDV